MQPVGQSLVNKRIVIDPQLFEILRCPQDSSRLYEAEPQLVQQINWGIAEGRVVNLGGHRVKKRIDSGLVREAGDVLYPVIDAIPVMLPDEAIDLSQISGGW